jgi:hypothetical protein
MRVSDIKLGLVGSESELSASVHGVPKGPDPFRLWFRFPAGMLDGIRRVGNPFLISILPVAARTGADLHVESEVSPLLIENFKQIHRIWSDWYGLKPGDTGGMAVEPNGEAASPGVACFFSGGVDSFYSVNKNLEREKGENRITHLLYVHGFDVDLEDHDRDSLVTGHLHRAGDELGLPVIRASTNLRLLADRFTRWGRLQHGAALAGVAHGLSGILGTVLVPSTHTYQHVFPWGTHPLLDPLWSDEFISFITDGCEATRTAKIERQIIGSDVALRHLRVCHYNRELAYNCGSCEKCLRTKVALKLAGVLERCATFDDVLDLEQIRSIRIKLRVTESFVRETLAELRRKDTEHDLQQALEAVLSRWNPTRIKIHLRDRFRI